MRYRTIKPEFWRDAKLRGVDPITRLVYIGLWQECNDAGWGVWDPAEIAADLFPYDDPISREPWVIGGFTELRERGLVKPERCGHYSIPTLPKHVAAAQAKRTSSVKRAHDAGACPRKPRGAAARRGVPPGRIREGRGGEDTNGLTNHQPNEEGETMPDEYMDDHLSKVREPQTPAEQAEVWATTLRGPVNGRVRAKAEEELSKLGYKMDGKELVKL